MPNIDPPLWYLRELADYTDDQNRLARQLENQRRQDARHGVFRRVVDTTLRIVGIRKPDEEK